MFAFLKKLFRRKQKKIYCSFCKHKRGYKDNSWGCTLAYVHSKHQRYGQANTRSICGNKKPKDSPKWCPLKGGRA